MAKSTTPGLEKLFDLYFDCFKAQLSLLPKIQMKVNKPARKELETYLGEGKPLLDTKTLPVDIGLFNSLFSQVLDVIKAHSEEPTVMTEQFHRLLYHPDLRNEEKGSVSPFAEKLLSFDTSYLTSLAKSLSLNPEILFFAAFQTLIPFLEKASLSVRDKFDYASWQRGFCPICGRKPSMAKYRKEDGLKLLQCSFCRSSWTYPEDKCAVCGNEDAETLEYIHTEEDDARRAEFCNKCRKYLKSVDCTKLGREVNLEIEDLVTAYLDEEAKRRGYESAGRLIYTFTVE